LIAAIAQQLIAKMIEIGCDFRRPIRAMFELLDDALGIKLREVRRRNAN